MSIRQLFSTIFVTAVLSTGLAVANAPITDQTAREQARNVVRSQLHLKPDQFLGVQRDEMLEQLLALAVGKGAGAEFIYEVRQTGDEIKEDAVVHHISTDADLVYVIAISSIDGSAFRIHGFTDSLGEFNKLIRAVKMTVSSPEQAQSVAEFYRKVNPENLPLARISGLIELKQAAERQCHTASFENDERAFQTWWEHAKPLYREVQFKETANPRDSGYLVTWIVLSSAGAGPCGGAAVRAHLEMERNAQVSKLTFLPLLQK